VLILDQLLSDLKDVCASFPDKRKGDGIYSMADIGLSAFSLFFSICTPPLCGERWQPWRCDDLSDGLEG